MAKTHAERLERLTELVTEKPPRIDVIILTDHEGNNEVELIVERPSKDS